MAKKRVNQDQGQQQTGRLKALERAPYRKGDDGVVDEPKKNKSK